MNLIKYDAAIHALAECKALDEVKGWSDKAAAMQAYGRMAKDKTLEIDAAEIRIRAERRLGELIALQKLGDGLNKGGRPTEITGTHKVPVSENQTEITGTHKVPVSETPTLAEVGISKNLSSRAQKLAAVSDDEFESEMSDWRDRVGQENARVSARLEKKGEQAIKRKEDQGSEYDSFDESSIEAEIKGEFDPVAELELALAQIDDLNKEIYRLNKIIEADDHLVEIKKLSDLNQVLESQKNGYLVSLNDQKRYSKMWKNKFEKLEKQMKASGLVEF